MGTRFISFLVVLSITLSPFVAYSHPGGTDRYGCHTDHSTGDYHCHDGGNGGENGGGSRMSYPAIFTLGAIGLGSILTLIAISVRNSDRRNYIQNENDWRQHSTRRVSFTGDTIRIAF